MRVRHLSLAVGVLAIAMTAQNIFAKDSVIRKPEAQVHAGDTIAISVSKILRSLDESHPQFPRLTHIKRDGQDDLAAWPITVLKDGTISLPLLKPFAVHGLTIKDLEKRILESYLNSRIVRPDEIDVIAAKIADKE